MEGNVLCLSQPEKKRFTVKLTVEKLCGKNICTHSRRIKQEWPVAVDRFANHDGHLKLLSAFPRLPFRLLVTLTPLMFLEDSGGVRFG